MKNEVARSQCKFLNTTSRDPVALASFPGSGNTWVRGLLQKATGICTGGIYCDTKLRLSGYPGESIRSGRTLVVKSHQVDPRWTGVYYPPNTTDRYFTKEIDIPVYDTAILLVRNPFHSLVSEWNRLISINMSVSDNHVNIIATQYFGEFYSSSSSSPSVSSFYFSSLSLSLSPSSNVLFCKVSISLNREVVMTLHLRTIVVQVFTMATVS